MVGVIRGRDFVLLFLLSVIALVSYCAEAFVKICDCCVCSSVEAVRELKGTSITPHRKQWMCLNESGQHGTEGGIQNSQRRTTSTKTRATQHDNATLTN
jgi:hypothetical protein